MAVRINGERVDLSLYEFGVRKPGEQTVWHESYGEAASIASLTPGAQIMWRAVYITEESVCEPPR